MTERTMNAWVKKEGVNGFVPVVVPVPAIGPNELLLQVKAVGICGTDIGIYAGKRKVPDGLIPGHEFCGDVVETGHSVKGFRVGDRVTPGIVIPCGACRPCNSGFEAQCENILEYGIHVHGAFAEYIAVEAKTAHNLPRDFSPVQGASIEPVAVAYNVVKKIGGPCLDRTALVYGPGPIGLYTTQLLRQSGFRHVVVAGLTEERLRVARRLGAETVNVVEENTADRLQAVTGRPRADVIVEATGSPAAVKDCLKVLAPHGRLVIAGIFHAPAELDLLSLVRNEITVTGAFCYTYDDYAHAVRIVTDGTVDFDPMVTHRLPLSELIQGFSLAMAEKAMKVVFEI